MEPDERLEIDFRRPMDQWMGGFGMIFGALLTLIVPWYIVILAALVTIIGAIIKIWKILNK
jgi:hypothetical protein